MTRSLAILLLAALPAHSQTIPAPKGADLIDAGRYDPRLTDCALWAITNLKRHPGSRLIVIIAPLQRVTSYAVTDGVLVWHDDDVYRIEDVRVIEREISPGLWAIEP